MASGGAPRDECPLSEATVIPGRQSRSTFSRFGRAIRFSGPVVVSVAVAVAIAHAGRATVAIMTRPLPRPVYVTPFLRHNSTVAVAIARSSSHRPCIASSPSPCHRPDSHSAPNRVSRRRRRRRAALPSLRTRERRQFPTPRLSVTSGRASYISREARRRGKLPARL